MTASNPSFSYNDNNIFARILRKELPAKIMHEDELTLAFYDINPVAPHHILLIPKGKYCNFLDFTNKAEATEIAHFFVVANKIASKFDCDFRIISNNGTGVGQSVEHFHIHLIAGKKISNLIGD